MPRPAGLLSTAIRRDGIRERSADCLAVPRLPGAVLPDSHLCQPPHGIRLVAEKAGNAVGEVAKVRDGLDCHVVDGFQVTDPQPLVDVQVHGVVERQTTLAGETGGHGPDDQPVCDFCYFARSGPDKVRTLTGSASGGV